MKTDADLASKLANLFLASARAVQRGMEAAGLPLQAVVPQTVVTRQDDESWSTATNDEHRNTLAVRRPSFGPWFTHDEMAHIHSCAEKIAVSATETLPFYSGLGGAEWPLVDSQAVRPTYELDPGGWVAWYLMLPALRHHLKALHRIDLADDAAAQLFANEVLRVAHDDQLRYRTYTPLGGMDLEHGTSEVTYDGVSIRRLSGHEQGAWYAGRGIGLIGQSEPPLVAVEVHVSGPRSEQYLPASGLAPFITAAFQLHSFRPSGHDSALYDDPVWLTGTTGYPPLTLPGRAAGTSVLTASGFRDVVKTARALTRYKIGLPRSAQDLAFHRFVAGAARQSDTDAVLDFTIALEALLLPYDENARRGDLGYRFRIHGAHYLSGSTPERLPVAKKLSGIYGMRSQLVHGEKYPEPAKISAARENAHELARRGLLRAVHEGFPKAEMFNQTVLGTTHEPLSEPQGRLPT
jgi:hypothetical protein